MRPNVIVTCTKRKRRDAITSLQLRSVRTRDLERRCLDWIERLKSADSDQSPALDLYAGEHWQIAVGLKQDRLGADVSVISAGYGLVPLDAPLKPYAATFSGNDRDAVVAGIPRDRHDSVRSQWWGLLARWRGPVPESPRSFAELAHRNPKRPLIVVGSEPYLRACASDLMRARDELANADLMMLVSAGARLDAPLHENLLPVDARLQHALGGTRQALNVRVARFLLTAEGQLFNSNRRARKVLTEKLDELPPIRRYDRTARSDEQVKQFIERRLRKDPSVRAHPLLRLLRDEGFACEQGRFSSLHREVREELGYA